MTEPVLFDVPATVPLPDLEGSPKQIEWASDIRRGKLRHCREIVMQMERLGAEGAGAARAELAVLEAMTSAREWIDCRDTSAGDLLRGLRVLVGKVVRVEQE